MVKTKPLGLSLDPAEVLIGTRGLEESYRVFVYILWLTGARTNEIAKLNQQDIYMKNGELWYSIMLSKLKRPEPLSNPLDMFGDDPAEAEMVGAVRAYWEKIDLGAAMFPWCKEHEEEQSWIVRKGKPDQEVHTGKVLRFFNPYDKIVRSPGYDIHARMDNGRLSGKVTLHWLRNFVITRTLLKMPGDPLFAMQRVGHKNLATTMRYFTASRAEFLAKRERLRSRSAPAPQPSPPQPEAPLPSGTASTSEDGLPPS